ncbi:MAG: hypothetical protein A3H23_07590 [Planctomycetes bacterium RIFCSPLOWO2_12_FULL_40_19]|nr:MAG: hypothetical protein A3H23_07590 [Planctomycetes bacterium RIFCSPLOWO2_12_FULL_40_19]
MSNDSNYLYHKPSNILRLSERQIYRTKSRVEREGINGILHNSRGTKRARWLTQDVKDRIAQLYNTKYKGFNITHVTEYLNTEEKIKISKNHLGKFFSREDFIP